MATRNDDDAIAAAEAAAAGGGGAGPSPEPTPGTLSERNSQFVATPDSSGVITYQPKPGSIAARDINDFGEDPVRLHNRLLSRNQLENERYSLQQHHQLFEETAAMQKNALERQKYIEGHRANISSTAMIHELGQLGDNPTHKQINDVVDKYSNGLQVKGTSEYVKDLRGRIDKARNDVAERTAASITDPEIKDVYNKSFTSNGDAKIANNDAKAAEKLKDRARNIAANQYTTDADRASLVDPLSGKVNWQDADKIQSLEDKANRTKAQAEGGMKHLKDMTTNFTNLSAALGEAMPADLKKNMQDSITQLQRQVSGQIPGTQAAEQGGTQPAGAQASPEDELKKLLGQSGAAPAPTATPTPSPATASTATPVPPETEPASTIDTDNPIKPDAAAAPAASVTPPEPAAEPESPPEPVAEGS